ncbi:acetyl-CoA carboxylase, biotin carboxyl carrier protein [Novosphingobium sp. Rr 2-17]|uniref:biotin/lipoyl-containing protein n=1 Tax=Novosphingobium sp. Rr 2-17 TaxID=555793 RepID=UPI000269A880|nr:biotin/lipoyl-containing protein [Novosphingobium sp. Rr 2-17]EIZ77813.1 acetyl-CoA carboxylase, biotin carboxyl carrier protein [Novosphingobium sp. Rr 2-17]
MTGSQDTATQAINDARALLDTLVANGWHEMHVVSGDTEIFLAAQGGGRNPMRDVMVSATAATPAPENVAVPSREVEVKAPHVATLVSLVAVDTMVMAGQRVATIRVLDDEMELPAEVSGTVARVNAAAGDLLDYATPIAVIAEGV